MHCSKAMGLYPRFLCPGGCGYIDILDILGGQTVFLLCNIFCLVAGNSIAFLCLSSVGTMPAHLKTSRTQEIVFFKPFESVEGQFRMLIRRRWYPQLPAPRELDRDWQHGPWPWTFGCAAHWALGHINITLCISHLREMQGLGRRALIVDGIGGGIQELNTNNIPPPPPRPTQPQCPQPFFCRGELVTR